MNLQALIGFILMSSLLSCGDDLGGDSKKRGSAQTDTPGLDGEDLPVTLINSHMHRTRGSSILTANDEVKQTLANTLPALYRKIPSMGMDDEGSERNVLTVSNTGRPVSPCGSGGSFTGIDARISDCNTKNGVRATWNANLNGIAGESTWQLVALTETGKEFWIDLKTGFVWSDPVGSQKHNWCKASGNQEASSIGVAIDCKELGESQNLCSGDIEGFGNNILWRLPTRNDYLQADLDGSRFVLSKSQSSTYWTATMKSGVVGRTEAWVYDLDKGTLGSAELSSEKSVRCIGAAIR